MNNSLSSSELLTIQVLQNELQNPTISYTYRNEVVARIEYILNKNVSNFPIIPTMQKNNWKKNKFTMKGT
jgi:hypothetical protein